MNKSNKKKMIKIVLWGHDFYWIGIDFDIDPIFLVRLGHKFIFQVTFIFRQ